MRTRTQILIVLLVFGLAGCETPREVNETALLLAAYSNKVKEDGEAFAQFRHELAKKRLSDLGVLERSTLATQQSMDTMLQIWTLSRENYNLDLFRGIQQLVNESLKQRQAMEKLKVEQEQALKDTVKAVNIRSGQLAETAKLLGQLGDGRTVQEDISFLGSFVKEVCDSLAQSHRETNVKVSCPKQ